VVLGGGPEQAVLDGGAAPAAAVACGGGQGDAVAVGGWVDQSGWRRKMTSFLIF
jgi:hypothetical protein